VKQLKELNKLLDSLKMLVHFAMLKRLLALLKSEQDLESLETEDIEQEEVLLLSIAENTFL